MEKNISYAYGPPTIVEPSFELYGEWLLAMNKPKEALQQFKQSLQAAPLQSFIYAGKRQGDKALKKLIE